MRVLRFLAAALVLAGAAWAIGRVTVAPYRCNYTRAQVSLFVDSLERNAGDYATTVRARRHLDEVRHCLQVCPTNLYDLVYEGVLLYTLERREEAIAAYQRALRHHHRPELYVDLGQMQLLGGERDEAFRNFLIALRFQPRALKTLDEETGILLPALSGVEDEVYQVLRREDPAFQPQ